MHKFYLAGRQGNVVHIQTKEYRRSYFPLCPTTASMRRQVAAWKDATKTRYDGNSRMVSLKRRPSINTESKVLATCKKTALMNRLSSFF